jgi:type 2 lantibiotic biosynthesis protein LanM
MPSCVSRLDAAIALALAPDEGVPAAAVSRAQVGAARALLARWEERVRALGSPGRDSLEARLRELTLDRASGLRRLLPRALDPSSPEPRWASTLREVVERAATSPPAELARCIDEERELPGGPAECPVFPELAAPFAAVALGRLPKAAGILGPAAREAAARELVGRISALAARTIALEVRRRAAAGELAGATPEARYRSFAASLGTPDGLLALVERYPVLGRHAATLTDQLAGSLGELAERTEREHRALEAWLGRELALPVTDLALGLSDPHAGGRTVARLRFACGTVLIYKPRSLAVDAAFARFVDWVNGKAGFPALRAASVHAREGYGFAEEVVPGEPGGETERRRYFERAGALTALLHFLAGNDFHAMNIVAAGDVPVPIDLEGLFAPGVQRPEGLMRQAPPHLRFLHLTAAGTGLLPTWAGGPDLDLPPRVTSGIAGETERESPFQDDGWVGLGTDSLRLDRRRTAPAPGAAPPLDRSAIDAVARGFSAAYGLVLEHRAELVDPDGPLAGFRGVEVRAFLRDTSAYADLLRFATSPDQLVSGAAHDVALEMLWLAPSVGAGEPLRVLPEEKRALWQRDVPRFRATGDDPAVRGEEGAVLGVVGRGDALSQARERITEASEADRLWQLAVFRGLFTLAAEPRGRANGLAGEARLLSHATAIGETLAGQALEGEWGAAWLSVARARGTRTVSPYAVAPWLYDGTCGIALFLAHLAAHTGRARFADLARAAFEHGLEALRWSREAGVPLQPSVSGGPPGLAYALAETARLLGDSALGARALAVALEDPPGEPSSALDLISGASGRLAMLLTVARMHPGAGLEERALVVGESILAAQGSDGGFRLEGPALGLGHGPAGIAAALLRLEAASGRAELAEAAWRALDHERASFDAKEQDWPRSPGKFMVGLCGGAPGAALARLAAARGGSEPGRRRALDDLEIALATTERRALEDRGPDNLCCGRAGQVLCLAEAGARLGRPNLVASARAAAGRLLERYESSGYWRLQTLAERSVVPGLMTGVSGIGLALLAAVDPAGVSLVPTLE